MKILFCDNSLRELLNFREEVINHYIASGCNVILVAPENRSYIPKSLQIKYIPVKVNRSSKNPFHDFSYYRVLCKIYKQEKPDYIFHYTIKPNIYGTLAAKRYGILSSAMIAGLGYVFNKNGIGNILARILYRYALRFADSVFVLNSYNYCFLQEKRFVSPSKLIHLIGGEGVDLNHFKFDQEKEKSDKIRFLMISRLLYDKGYQEYVEAAKEIHYKFPTCEFQLLGGVDKEYPNHVPLEQVRQDEQEGHIKYLGYQSNVVQYIQLADCIVLPSYNEGLSRVLMEGLAMGKPIITTDIPGCRETVVDGKNGYLIPARDKTALVQAIIKFLQKSDKEYIEMSRYSRQKAEKEFDIREVIKVYQKVTEKIHEN